MAGRRWLTALLRIGTWMRASGLVALRMLPRHRLLRALPVMSSRDLPLEIAFVTDVEGDIQYFNRWVRESSVLRYGPGGGLELTHAGARFVYGGDTIDRGDGDIRLLQLLADLKRKYPDRVTLLVGNRDLNKLRLTSELGPADMARHPRDIPPPHWDKSAPTLLEYLGELASEVGAGGAEEVDCRAARLRYMYAHTLGCPQTFEFRRREMGLLQGRESESVTDEEVVQACAM